MSERPLSIWLTFARYVMMPKRASGKLGTPTDLTINAAEDWDRLSLDAQRDLIRAVVDSVTVAPGGGPDRVSILLV